MGQLRLKLGLLGGDLLCHLGALSVQLGGQRVIADGQNLSGQHSGILRAIDGHGSHGDAAGHLDGSQQSVQPIRSAALHGDANDRQGGISGEGAR